MKYDQLREVKKVFSANTAEPDVFGLSFYAWKYYTRSELWKFWLWKSILITWFLWRKNPEKILWFRASDIK